MDVLTIIVEILFGILFVSTLIVYLRRRDSLSRDVMLIFASVAGLLFFANLQAVAGSLPAPVVGLAFALLLAAPLFTLRLTNQILRVPRALLIAAVVGYLLTAVPMVVLPAQSIGPVVLAAVVVFVLTDLLAAIYLVLAARRRVGSARVRLWAAAVASGLFAAGLAFSVVASAIPATDSQRGTILELTVLAVAILYLLGFLPPPWLRRVWGAVTAYSFTEDLMDAAPDEDAAAVWSRLAALAVRSTGADAAVVLAGDPPRTMAVHARQPVVADALRGVTLEALPAAIDPRQPLTAPSPLSGLAAAAGARFAGLLSFEMAGEDWALVLLRQRPSLFDTDDEEILRGLIGRAAVFAERTGALAEQAALAQRLAVTVEALERASQAKSDFLASMSHELRTPLSAIIGFSALMREEPLADGARSVPDEWIEHVHRGGEHLLALINDVLDLTKIEAGRIQLEPEAFELSAALAESVEGMRPLADRKRIHMTLDAQPGVVEADRGRVRQIAYNLLSNAIKFTPEGGTIRVTATWSDHEAVIGVQDSGVGIAPEDHERVFEEFRQVGDLKARQAGTGLGLALSRRLAEAHGGRLTLDSSAGAGARFEFTLPGARMASAREATSPQPPSATAESAGLVLVIEDDPGAVRLLRTYLESEGYRVNVAGDGESGLAAAHRQPPDAILLDVLLPGIDGWEVLRRLKADSAVCDVPVVVVSVVDERNVAMSLGAADYLLKPVRPDALLTRLGRYTFTTKVKHRRVRVLAIDDEQAARDMVVSALRPEGFDVVTAASGQEGVAMAMDDPPDLVICDLVMPDMDGYEVVERLHGHEATREATILILTAQDLSLADRQRLNGKVADVLYKDGDPRRALARWLLRAAPGGTRHSMSAVAR